MPKIAIVGSGEGWRRLSAASLLVDELESVSISESSPQTPSLELREILERSEVDGIAVCSPVRHRISLGELAARAGKQVLIESPIGASVDEIERLLAICEESGVTLTLLESQRSRPLVNAVRTAIAADSIGSPRFAHFTSVWHWPADDAKSVSEVDFLLEFAPGLIDVAMLLMTEPDGQPRALKQVFARSCSENDGVIVRYVSIILVFVGGVQVVCEIGRTSAIAPRTGLQSLAITGLKGSIHHDLRKNDVVIGPLGMRPLGDDAIAGTMAALAAWSSGKADFKVENAVSALRWTLATAESIRSGQPAEVAN